MKATLKVVVGAVAFCTAGIVWAADDAEAIIKKSGCGKCHSVSAKKVGPSYKDIAAKLKGNPGAADELTKHLTTNPKVKVDGKEETHPSLKTKNPEDVKTVVNWILGQ